jgi:hypothetical protein
MNAKDARRFVFELDLDVGRLPICLACLSFVSFAVDEGNPHKIAGATRRMTPDLWAEGLELPAWTALEDARDRGVDGADEAIADVLERGPHSAVARAIVRRLGEQLSERAGGDRLKMGFEPWPPRERLRAVPPLDPPEKPLPPLEPLTTMEVRIWRFPDPT